MKLLTLVTISLLWVSVFTKSVQTNSKGNHQCEYNGKTYNEGEELISTRRLCLNCTCTKEFVEPNDYNCNVITCKNIEPLERGCMPIYDEVECCPVNWNCSAATPLSLTCEKQYLKHYEVKGCTPVLDETSDCPVHYICPDKRPQNYSVCTFNGKTYKEGDEIDIGNPCQICSCRKSYDHEGVDINCIFIECPQAFGPPLNSSCYRMYQADKCCAVKTQCETDAAQSTEKTCEYDGKKYRYGERIYPNEDKCKVCYCNEQWSGVNGDSCESHDCALDLKRKQLDAGCIPIYHEATCCPIEFYCGTPEEGFQNTTVSFASKQEIETGQTCVFKGVHYSHGQTLNINHPTNCVTCTCITPPDFTCVHRSCPRPPNDDYENCVSNYNPGECCPTYNCKEPSEHLALAPVPIPQCSPVVCPKGCSEVTVHNSCPFCMCQEKLCAPPKCDAGCVIQKNVPEGKCPSCECPAEITVHQPLCAPVKCAAHCFEVTDSKGCSVCMCGPICTPPICEPGCELDRNVPDGECPKCSCFDDNVSPHQLQCSPVKCIAGCTESIGESGCPSCVCKPLCSPPKCDPGCYLNPFPTGPCPECICENKESVPQLLCSPVKCGPLCHEAYGKNGCPTCICDPMCSTPVCEGNCELKFSSDSGPCPVCVCKKDHSFCPFVTCGPMCEKRIGSDGCPTCACSAVCSPPICEPGCHLEYDRAAGPCASCVCPSEEIQCSPVKCAENCIEAIGDNGCHTCICNPQCSPPKCKSGCEIRYSKESGQCPTCMCFHNDELPLVQCSPPKCDEPGCHIDYTTQPCPSCVCRDSTIPLIQCSPPKCDEPGCHIDYSAQPCPNCVCGDVPVLQCSPPKCDEPGCHINYNAKPCPDCICGASNIPVIQCSPPKCDDPGCHIDYSAKPCPDCVCGDANIPLIQCSPPKCDEPGCHIDYSAKPCPNCVCGDSNIPLIQCSPPKCDEPGCHIDYTAKPCPNCDCGDSTSAIQCSPPKCDPWCKIDYNSKPCPSCDCDRGFRRAPPRLQCAPLGCPNGCRQDFSTKPCPSCVCERKSEEPSGVQCSPVRCPSGCTVDYNSKPCPSCNCEKTTFVSPIQCSPPRCAMGCRIDYTARPCPRCSCDEIIRPGFNRIRCSPLKCPNECYVDQNSKPCPRCVCDEKDGIPDIMCSPPMCDNPGCKINYLSKPCPSCECDNDGVPNIMCSPPKCDEPGCRIDYSTQPCPSCACGNQGGVADIMCSPPKCDGPGCRIDYSAKPCPTCNCEVPDVMCSPPKCDDPGCRIDYSTKPCPSCVCGNPGIMCSPPKCDDPGCSIDYSAKPCPSCVCGGTAGIMCSPPKCDEPGCTIDYSSKPCPSCTCGSQVTSQLQCSPVKCNPGCIEAPGVNGCPYCQCKPACSPPNCGPGCRIDYNAEPCPSCICDRFSRRSSPIVIPSFSFHNDPVCRNLRCGPNCALDQNPTESDRCPMCICDGRVGEKIKCLSMQCELPCRFKRFSSYGCPVCMCHSI